MTDSLADVLGKDPAKWERWGQKCSVSDIDASFVTVLPRNPEHSNNRIRVALPKTHPQAKAIAQALERCRKRFEGDAELNGGCAPESLFVPFVVAEDGGVGFIMNVSRRKLDAGELGAVHVKLPNDACPPGTSMDLEKGQGVLMGVDDLLDMDKPAGAVYRFKLMVMKWCLDDGGAKKAGFSISLAGRRDREMCALMLFNADSGSPAYVGSADLQTARASVAEVEKQWDSQAKRGGYDVNRLNALAIAISMTPSPDNGLLQSPNFGMLSYLCCPDGQLAQKLNSLLLTPAKFGELNNTPTRGSYNENNSCLTAWLHACRGGNTQWYINGVSGICLRTTREEQRFPWTLKVGLPDGDAAARALKQNLMRLYNKSLDLLPQHIVSLMGSDLPPPQADAVLEFAKKKSQIRDKAMLQSIDDPDLPELAPKNEDEISEFLPITMRNDERQFSVRIEDDTALYWHASEDADPQRIDSIDAVADGSGHKFVKVRRAVVQMRLNVKTNFRAKKSRSVLLLREPRLIIKAVALQLQPAEALSGMGAADEPPPKRLCF